MGKMRQWFSSSPPAEGEEPLVRAGHGGFLQLERIDLIMVFGLVLLALCFRYLTPLPMQLPKNELQGVNTTLWGAGYPFNTDTGETPPNCQDIPVSRTSKTFHEQCEGFVFDEVYFTVDAWDDLHSPPVPYYDPEPPLTKLLMSVPMFIGGYTTWTWRFAVALFGSFDIGLLYLIAMRLKRDRFFATIAALCMCFDGLAFVESRIGVIDIIALFFIMLCYYTFLLHWQARTKRQWRATLYCMAAAVGLGFAAKLTALAPIAVIGAFIAIRCIRPLIARKLNTGEVLWLNAAWDAGIWHYLTALAFGGVVFLACWAHFNAPHTTLQTINVFTSCTITDIGSGAAASPSATLYGGSYVIQPAVFGIFNWNLLNDLGQLFQYAVHYTQNVIVDMQSQVQYHLEECAGHPASSEWYTWPIMYHPVFMYYGQASVGAQTYVSEITNVGNPAVWWGALPALFAAAVAIPPTLKKKLIFIGALTLALTSTIIPYHAAEKSALITIHVNPDRIHLFGIPIFDVGLFGFLVLVGAMLVWYGCQYPKKFLLAFCLLSYLVGWYMWEPANQARVLFFYHALPLLPFMSMLIAWWLTKWRSFTWVFRHHPYSWYVAGGLDRYAFFRGGAPQGEATGRTLSFAFLPYAAIMILLCGFIFFYPVYSGLPQTIADHAMRVWVDMP